MKKHLLLLLFFASVGVMNAQKPVSGKPSAEKKTEDLNYKALEFIGLVTTQHIYNTYLCIGSVMDNFVSEGYTAETTGTILDEQVALTGQLIEELKKLKNDVVTVKSDRTAIETMITILGGLKKQAEYGKLYSTSKDTDDASKFDEQRKENWEAISKFMGLDK